jgi:AcrR family transcriptional regulator
MNPRNTHMLAGQNPETRGESPSNGSADLSKRRSVTRANIVSTALRLFRVHGFCRVGVEEVCSGAGITKKTFYQYFAAKDDLVEAVVEQVCEKIEQATSGAFGAAPDEPLEQLLALQHALAVRLPEMVSVPLARDLKARRPELWQLIGAMRREVFSRIELVIIDGQRRGVFRREVDPHLVTLMFLGAIVEIVRPETLVHSAFSLHQAIDGVFGFFLHALVTDPKQLGSRHTKKRGR